MASTDSSKFDACPFGLCWLGAVMAWIIEVNNELAAGDFGSLENASLGVRHLFAFPKASCAWASNIGPRGSFGLKPPAFRHGLRQVDGMDRRQGEVGAPAQPWVQRGNAAFSGALISARDSDNIACLRMRQPQNWWLSFLWFPFGNSPKRVSKKDPPPYLLGMLLTSSRSGSSDPS